MTGKPLRGFPGIGGSLGCCGVCGGSFIMECLLGQNVRTMSIDGLDCDIAVHNRCAEILKTIKKWEELPQGPLRKAFEEAAAKVDSAEAEKGTECQKQSAPNTDAN